MAKIKVMLRIKRAEDELRAANENLERKVAERTQALRASEERYRRITGAITNYIYTVRVEEGRAVETAHGEACFAVTGYSKSAVHTRFILEKGMHLISKPVHKRDLLRKMRELLDAER